MAVNVGGVMVEFDGDASGAAAAMKAVSDKLDELVAKEKNLKAALDAANSSGNASEDTIRALKTAHAEAATAVAKLTGKLSDESAAEKEATKAAKAATEAAKAAEKAKAEQAKAAEKLAQESARVAETHGVLGERARKVDEVMGTLQTSVGGVASAFGVQGQAMTDVIGAVADVAKSLGSGGPLLAAVTVAGAAIAALASQFEKSAERAREAYKKLLEEAKTMSDQLAKDLENLAEVKKEKEIETMTAGLSAEQAATVRMFIDTADAEKSLRDFEKRFGLVPANLNSVVSGVQEMTRDLKRVPEEIVFGYTGDPGFNKYADTLVKTYEQLQQKVIATKSAGEAGVTSAKTLTGIEAGREATESQITEQYNALIRALDANTAAMEIDTELSEGQYTAEDRATREERGVLEVSKEEFDAGLAGIDPDEASRITEEALTEIFDPFHKATEKIISTIDSMSAADIEKMNSDFLSAGEAALDLRDGFEIFKESLASNVNLAANQLSDTAWSMLSGGDMNAGAIAGGVAGAVGTALGGPVAGKIAAEIGSKVGDALESFVAGFMDLIGDDRFSSAMGEATKTPLALSFGPAATSFALPALLPIAGLSAFTFALSKSTESFARFQGAMGVVVDKMVSSLEPLWESMLWMVGLFDLFSSIMAPFFDMISSGMKNILGETLFNVFKTLLVLFTHMAYVVANTTNFLWELAAVTAQLTGADEERVAKIRENKVDMVELTTAMREARSVTYEQAQAIGEANAATYDATKLERDSMEQKTSLSLTNVPSGYKALGGIYAAADAEMRGTETMSSPINVIIQNWWSNRAIDKDFLEISNIARSGLKTKKTVSRRYGGDKN